MAAALLFAIALSGCSKDNHGPPLSDAVRVKVQVVGASEITQRTPLIGRMDSRHAVAIYPKIDGHISRILVKPGDEVKPGQLLLEIDDLKQQAIVAEKQSDVKEAQADYDKEVASLKTLESEKVAQEASTEYERHEYVRNYWLQQRDVVSEATVDAHDRQYKVARAKLDSIDAAIAAQQKVIQRAARGIESAKAQLREQLEQLSYYRLTAPFNGSVGDVPVKKGDYVSQQTRLTTVSQMKPLELKVQVPQDLASSLTLGMKLELIDDDGNVIGTCPIFHIDPIVDPDNQSILIIGLYPNQSQRFRPEQTVSTQLVLSHKLGVKIPTEALTFIAGRAFAYVVSNTADNKQAAQQRQLELSDIQDNMAVVKSGIKQGDRLIISGVQSLRDGVAVIVE